MIDFAAAHPAEIRLSIALIGLVFFGAVATTRWQHPVPAVAVAVLSLISAGWLFGATLVWGTGYATKVRWTGSWTYNGFAWQWTALLAVAVLGIVSMGLALRLFAHQRRRRAWMFAALAGAAFVCWSAVVRYSVGVGVVVLAAGLVAFWFVDAPGRIEAPERTDKRTTAVRSMAAVPVLLAAIVAGIAWALYAFGWLVVGPEGRASCNCWADRWNDWQYQIQFLVAVLGAVTLVSAAVCFVVRRRRLLLIAGPMALAAIVGWTVFVVTG